MQSNRGAYTARALAGMLHKVRLRVLGDTGIKIYLIIIVLGWITPRRQQTADSVRLEDV